MKLRIFLVFIAIIGLSLAVILELSHIAQMGSTWRKDDKLIPILQEVSRLVPKNESIVTSSFDPVLLYFSNRHLEIPNNISSYNSLIESMDKNNLTYFLIIEGEYNVPSRDTKFDSSHFTLERDFKEIATFDTEFSVLHLYKRI